MRSIFAAAFLALTCPIALGAWGVDVHRDITARALDGLPPEIAPFFLERRDFIVEHAVDPDLWRVVGLSGEMGPEDPNHYLDIDGLDELPPFDGVPRARAAFLARYGRERAERAGRLPWRVGDVYTKLVDALRRTGTGAPYAADNARYLAAVLAHYVEDSFVPFHAVLNHDGQLTNQQGLHARFETTLVQRNRPGLTLAPVAIQPIPDVVAFIFDTLSTSASLTSGILDADRRAAADRSGYGDAYYDAFFAATRPVLEARLSGAASGVASMITAAWIDAGRPVLPTK